LFPGVCTFATELEAWGLVSTLSVQSKTQRMW
jgi:hypothetical protein